MYTGIFVFGTKIFEETRRDVISSMPLEISWKIFSYLDDTSLRFASRACKLWNRIIIANRELRSRLNKFELSIKLGSKSLAKFYRRNKKIFKKIKPKNYLAMAPCTVESTKITTLKCKRGGDEITVCTKRYRLF